MLFIVCYRWEDVITHVPCGGTRNDPAGRLLISATQTAIDGVGNTLSSAGPSYVWIDCPGVTIEGEMEFDVDDLALMDKVELEFLYLHEIGHVIGFGSVMLIINVHINMSTISKADISKPGVAFVAAVSQQ